MTNEFIDQEYYNTIAPSYNELHGEEQLKKLSQIEPYLNSKSILDVGCGTGIASPKDAVGLDPSYELLKQNPNEFKVGYAEDLPFEDKSFDIITCLTAIHHFHIDKSLAEMERVAKKKIIISVLKKAKNFDEIIDKIKSKFKVNKIILEEKDIILIANVNNVNVDQYQ